MLTAEGFVPPLSGTELDQLNDFKNYLASLTLSQAKEVMEMLKRAGYPAGNVVQREIFDAAVDGLRRISALERLSKARVS